MLRVYSHAGAHGVRMNEEADEEAEKALANDLRSKNMRKSSARVEVEKTLTDEKLTQQTEAMPLIASVEQKIKSPCSSSSPAGIVEPAVPIPKGSTRTHLLAADQERIKETEDAEMKYPCPYCPKRYRAQAPLTRHLRTQHSEGSEPSPNFHCLMCGQVDFPTKQKLLEHIKEAHDTHICPICGRGGLSGKGGLAKHIKAEHEHERGVCQYCHVEFLQANLEKHEAICDRRPDVIWTCSCCGKTSTSKQAHDSHRLRCTGNVKDKTGWLTCEKCKGQYKKGKIFTEHQEKCTGTVCTICNQDCRTFQALQQHKRYCKTEVKVSSKDPAKCPFLCVCGERFSKMENMKIHQRRCGKFQTQTSGVT